MQLTQLYHINYYVHNLPQLKMYNVIMNSYYLYRRIHNMEAALLPDERTELVSTNMLGHGWAYKKLANQQAIF